MPENYSIKVLTQWLAFIPEEEQIAHLNLTSTVLVNDLEITKYNSPSLKPHGAPFTNID